MITIEFESGQSGKLLTTEQENLREEILNNLFDAFSCFHNPEIAEKLGLNDQAIADILFSCTIGFVAEILVKLAMGMSACSVREAFINSFVDNIKQVTLSALKTHTDKIVIN
jgi:hypothetical protein